MDKVLVGIASGSHVVSQFAMALADLAAYISPHYEYCGLLNVRGVLIDDARNKIVNRFLMTQGDWLMMFDTDLEFSITIIDQLLEMHNKCGTKAGCGWYNVNMNGRPKPALFFVPENGDHPGTPIINAQTPEYLEVDAGPSGGMLIHREVFEKMRDGGEKYYFKFTHTDNETITEDMYFCKLLKKYGYKFMACRDARMLHYKMSPI